MWQSGRGENAGAAHLHHEAGDDAVEGAALEVQWLAQGAHALLARAESLEVGDGEGHGVAKQPDGHSAQHLLAHLHLQEHPAHAACAGTNT